jgi:signal transduction histidine kinase
VSVCDAGIGIGARDRDAIFDTFHTTKADGMGMGLPISRSIVEAHGGRLWATPNDHHGETFRFTLPFALP